MLPGLEIMKIFMGKRLLAELVVSRLDKTRRLERVYKSLEAF